MNKEEIIKLAQKAGLIRAGENYTEPARWGISEITDFYSRVAAAEREAFPNLTSVINWLENGCDPKEAAKELRLYAAAIRARGEVK